MNHLTKILALLAGLSFGVVTADAATHLRQSDAVEVVIGPFVDATDGVTAETALTITSSEVFIKKCTAAGDCAVSAAKNEATSATHDGRGYYEVDFDTTDTNTVGTLYLSVAESGAAPVWAVFEIVEEAVFDRDYATAATGLIGTAQTGDSFVRIGAAGASLTAIDLPNQTMDITGTLTTVTTATNVTTVNGLAANVITDAASATDFETRLQTEANDALVALELDQLLSATYNPAAEPAADSLFGDLTESDGGVTRFNTNALEQGPIGGGVSAAAVADEVQARLGTLVKGTATGGSTTTAQDTVNLTQAANDWFNNRSMIVFTSGNVAGHVACVRDFVAATDTLSFAPAAPNAIVAQQFVVLAAPQCATTF